MEKGEFSLLYQSYRELRETVAVNGFYSLVAGLIIATFVFKLFDMANDMAKEEKGFSAKHFFELGREYILRHDSGPASFTGMAGSDIRCGSGQGGRIHRREIQF